MNESLSIIDLLPNGRKIRAKKGKNLLTALMAHNIFLRSDCGGKGVCGKCKVESIGQNGVMSEVIACTTEVVGDMSIKIPESSILSAYIVSKAMVVFPQSFLSHINAVSSVTDLGVAIDLGTTTIAIYLCNIKNRTVISSTALKNPQALYGDDVMSRIGVIGEDHEKLVWLQQLVVKAIEWGIRELFKHSGSNLRKITQMVVVGNPAMIHILLGVSPYSIGISPYKPAFFEARNTKASKLGFEFPHINVHTLDQVAGFIGGDILSAILATELESEPVGTLLVDLGTNGELVIKGKNKFYATSCATGPAFEGAALSCGMQAILGAIDRVAIAGRESAPEYSVIKLNKEKERNPLGLCGSGVISAVAALVKAGIVDSSGRFEKKTPITRLKSSEHDGWRYIIVSGDQSGTGREIFISQKDIRSVQLGKAALITGIEFLLRAAGLTAPAKIIIAGAFGSYLDKYDMLALGMVPTIDPSVIKVAGNSAGAGAVMALCDDDYLAKVRELANKISVIELAANIDFNNTFIQRLAFLS